MREYQMLGGLLVPTRLALRDLPAQRQQAHEQLITSRRREVMREIRGLSLSPELRAALRPDELYRLALPDGVILQKGKDGLYSGVVYNQKGIATHARFSKVHDNTMRLAKGIGTQVMLVSIAMQLNRIERLVESLFGELHRDRLADVQAGLISLNEATAIENTEIRNQSLVNAIQTLNIGLQKNYLEMKAGIEALPSPENSFWDNWGMSSKSKKVAKRMLPLQETLCCYLEGLSGLAECYAMLDEPMAAIASVRSRFHQLSDLDPARVGKVAQLVAETPEMRRPEEPWQRLTQSLPHLGEITTEAENANKPDGHVLIEVTGSELTEVADVHM